MSAKKRQSDGQGGRDSYESDNDSNSGNESKGIAMGWKPADAAELSTRRIVKAKIPQKSSSTADSVNPFLGLIFGNPPAPATSTTLIDSVLNPILSKEDVGNSLSPSQPVIEASSSGEKAYLGGGFLAYSSSNPFAAVAAANSLSSAPSTFSSFAGIASFKSSGGISGVNPKKLTIEATSINNENQGISQSLISPKGNPSPKSPKHNPFSSTSPKVNPFVKIAEGCGQDDVWFQKAASSAASGGNDFSVVETSPSAIATESSQILPVVSSSSSPGFNSTAGASAPAATKSFFASFHNKHDSSSQLTSSTLRRWGADDSLAGPRLVEDKGHSSDKSDNDDNASDRGDNNEEENVSSRKIVQLPDNIMIVTGEEEEECLMEVRAKLFRWTSKPVQSNESYPNNDAPIKSASSNSMKSASSDSMSGLESSQQDNFQWVEVGVGPIRLLRERKATTVSPVVQQDTTQSNKVESKNDDIFLQKSRVVMRREEKKGGQGTKLLFNSSIRSYVNIAKQGDRAFRIVCFHSDGEDKSPTQQAFVFRTKHSQESDKLFELLNEQLGNARKAGY